MTITHQGTGDAVPDALVGSPSIAEGTTVLQIVDGSELQADALYTVLVTVTITESKIETMRSQLRCVGP